VKQLISFRLFAITLFSFVTVIYACSKGGGTTTPPPPDPCAGVTVAVSGTVANPSAPGASDGSITASASGSTGFTFSINGGAFQSSGTFNNLAAGSYTVTAKNGSGCNGSSSFTLTAPNPCAGITITVNGTLTNPSSTLTSNGSIVATASGSTGFTFNINGGIFQASGTFSSLPVGSYTIVAKNGNGCTGSAVFSLTAPNPCAGVTITVNGTVTNPTAVGSSNGSIAATALGSTGFTFNINGGAFQASGTFNNLAAGSHTIIAKDLNGCTGLTVFTLTAPNPCAGVTITMVNTITGNTPCEGNNGAITVVPSGGTGPYSFSLNSGAFQLPNTFSNLAAGTYTVTAKDANGCSGSSSAVVNNLAAGPLFSAVRTLIQNNCTGCHNASQAEGGMNFSVDCNIVINKDRIRARAVDGSPSSMPPTGLLSASDRQKITDWINAGGRFSN
jgi:hypothetical protein